ncbi:MAG: FMN-binding negative transcriptional regulator [Patiriisocius sp.]|uniref:FMN-binding negative transcriptional regulator n=1 Tax=Patiriisocius sp. TaxID=2822396 RepID=UPI003EF77306
MYPPPHHQETDIQKMIAVIKQFPLGMLVSAKYEKPFVTHIPIIYNDTTGKLVAHIDKFNPQIATLKDGAEVTVVFKGPDCYISPSIYTTTQLSTWNYIIVHVTGTITLINDPNKAKETMIAMTNFLEQPEQAYRLEKENPRMEAAVKYIQAFDIEITNWEGKFKLSQDKNAQDQENAKQQLIKESRDGDAGFILDMY